MSAFETVMEGRRQLVVQVIENMQKGYVFTRGKWDADALAPHNPLTKVRYQGGNRMRLISQAIRNGYQDPRWMTARQLKEKGYYIKKGERQTVCEKWVFTEERTAVNGQGEKKKETVRLEKPIVRYFGVFNAEQVEGFPPLEKDTRDDTEVIAAGIRCMASSECRILECAQPEAYYSLGLDRIVLPPRQMFKDDVSYVSTGLHEIIHSTGHKSRLDRDMGGGFGSPGYAKEELRAELGAMFLKADLGISLQGEHFQDHSNYLKSWIKALHDDPNELFRAAADAERAASRVMENHRAKEMLPQQEPKPIQADVTLTQNL